MPFFLRHYSAIADQITIYDNNSSDKSVAIARACAKVAIEPWETNGVTDDWAMRDLKNTAWHSHRSDSDWQIVVDMDEFLFHPLLLSVLRQYTDRGVTLPRVAGFDMISGRFPADRGQLYDSVRKGHPSEPYSKCVVFNPQCVEINYGIGCHTCQPIGDVQWSVHPDLKLLHFKRLGHAYTVKKARDSARRLSIQNRKAGYGVHHDTYAVISKSEFEANLETARTILPMTTTKDPDSRIAVVLGAYRSGTSCLAGVLHHLGHHMGRSLLTNDADHTKYYEPRWLHEEFIRRFAESTGRLMGDQRDIINVLRQWRSGMVEMGPPIGIKLPLLCLLVHQLREAWGESGIRWITVDRPVEDAARSLQRCEWRWMPPNASLAYCMERIRHLINERDRCLGESARLSVSYDELCKQPRFQIDRIVRFLGLVPTLEQLWCAETSVDRRGTETFNPFDTSLAPGEANRQARDGRPAGWFTEEQGRVYRDMIFQVEATRIVEVGTWKGRSLSYILDDCRSHDLSICCVDTWQGSPIDRTQAIASRVDIFEQFYQNMANVGATDRINVIRSTSLDASHLIDDASLDFVMIDGDHSYGAVAQDIRAWLPKVRPGGIIMGHDYDNTAFPGVAMAVESELGRVDVAAGLWYSRR